MAKPADLTGRRFGWLIAVEATEGRSPKGYVLWKCRCVCDTTVLVASSHLLEGKVQSCGCWAKKVQATNCRRLKGEALAGRRFGPMIAEAIIGKHGRYSLWRLRCSRCGQCQEGTSAELRSARNRRCNHCGCSE